MPGLLHDAAPLVLSRSQAGWAIPRLPQLVLFAFHLTEIVDWQED